MTPSVKGWGQVLTELTLEMSGVCPATGRGTHTLWWEPFPQGGGQESAPLSSRPQAGHELNGRQKVGASFLTAVTVQFGKKNPPV